MPDSLKTSWQKVDSIRHEFNVNADSIRQSYQQSMSSIDSAENQIRTSLDSLNKLSLSSNRLVSKLDSLNNQKQKLETDLNQKLDRVKSKTVGKLDKIEMTPEMEGPVGEFKNKVNGFKVTSNNSAIPALQIPGYSLPEMSDLKSLDGISNLTNMETPLGNVGEIGKQAEGFGSDLKNISQGNLKDVQQIPQTIEQQASNIDGIQELQKSSQIVDGYEAQLDAIKSEEALKTQGMNMAKKEAINHFAGKEKELKAAMDKLSEYKQKYSSIKTIKDLPKHPPNAMNGKPLMERLVPGLWLQFQLKEMWMVDVNPYAGYKISGRFTSGFGWNQRFAFNEKTRNFVGRSRIFGPRAFLDFSLGRGFVVHLEEEAMNCFVPSTLRSNPDNGKREWVWGTMLGIKKQYRIYKNLNGTVLIQYNLVNQYIRTPYLDRLNSRMGFEYKLKKKQNINSAH
jgi:hypothetical protein